MSIILSQDIHFISKKLHKISKKQQKRRNPRISPFAQSYRLFVLALSCSFRLLLALYAGLLIVFSLAKLGKDTGTSALTLKATKGTVQRLAFFNFYFCHFYPSLRCDQKLTVIKTITLFIIHDILLRVNRNFKNKSEFFYFFDQRTTMLMILLGTTISLTRVLPSIKDATEGTALAMASAVSRSAFKGSSTLPLTLPLI